MHKNNFACPCGSSLNYEECCKRFHEGIEPENALQLMQSRYSAYVLNLPDYIIKTTHPASPHYTDNHFSWKRSISGFAKNSIFRQLEILDFKERLPIASVTFTAHLDQNGEDATFTETSYFERWKNGWRYRNGQLWQGCAPHAVTKEPLNILPLAYYGDEILRRKADLVVEINSELKTLVGEMIDTMNACNGIGLAAPQIHRSIRLFVAKDFKQNSSSSMHEEVKIFINPKILWTSEKNWTDSEGCLSIPAIRSNVERPEEIVVEYTNLKGEAVKETYSGWGAKVILHENDHIDGILFIDRIPADVRAKLEPALKNLQNRIHH